MASRRSVLLALACVLELSAGSLACSGDAQSGGSGGKGTTAGEAGSNVGSAGAHSGAGGSVTQAAGAAMGGAAMGGAAMGGTAMGGAAMGGTAMGGTAMGGASAGQSGAGTSGTGSGCSMLSQTRFARTGKSAGFAGDYVNDYYPLYSHACTTLADCSAACVTAGGTQASCAASECVDSSPDYCLPPTYWIYFDMLLTEGNSQDSSAQIIMVNNPYRDQLLASNFQFEIPSGAKILGVSFAINEAAGSENMIADFSVRALNNGVPVGLDRGHSTAWTTTFHPEIYGGAADLWGATWTADSVNAAGFGVGLTPLYLDTAGNERAYVDIIHATVTYDACN